MPPEDEKERYRVTIMSHPNKGSRARGKADWDRTRIQVNSHLTLTGVPERASEWILGPRPAFELFLQRMRPSVDKKSWIRNDPNERVQRGCEVRCGADQAGDQGVSGDAGAY